MKDKKKDARLYGKKPYRVAVIHGGPGAPGSMVPVANALKHEFGIIEPLQTADTVEGQIKELKRQLTGYSAPFTLIGHSWGAWLIWMFAARYPEKVEHIILVSSGPFDEEYVKNLMETRLQRLNEKERAAARKLIVKMHEAKLSEKEFSAFGSLMTKADSYCYHKGSYKQAHLPSSPHIFESVWQEAAKMRSSGELIALAPKIKCKITVIHGEYDLHPYQGVRNVFNEHGVNFDFILLKKCGHTPWHEKHAAEGFFAALSSVICK